MTALEALQAEPHWQLAIRLARNLLRLAAGQTPAEDDGDLAFLGYAIPRSLAEAHIAATAQEREEKLGAAVEHARRADIRLQALFETGQAPTKPLLEALWQADQLRETVFHLLHTETEICRSA